jgi:hypothetical protein
MAQNDGPVLIREIPPEHGLETRRVRTVTITFQLVERSSSLSVPPPKGELADILSLSTAFGLIGLFVANVAGLNTTAGAILGILTGLALYSSPLPLRRP